MPSIERHGDHDPDLPCRPIGAGLCEVATADAVLSHEDPDDPQRDGLIERPRLRHSGDPD